MGRLLVDHLLNAGATDVRALTNRPAQAALPPGVDIVEGMAQFARHPQRPVPTVEEILGHPGTKFAEWAVEHAHAFR